MFPLNEARYDAVREIVELDMKLAELDAVSDWLAGCMANYPDDQDWNYDGLVIRRIGEQLSYVDSTEAKLKVKRVDLMQSFRATSEELALAEHSENFEVYSRGACAYYRPEYTGEFHHPYISGRLVGLPEGLMIHPFAYFDLLDASELA